MRRDARIENLRGDRREDAEFVRLGQPRGVDRQENVGRAVAALVPDPLEQFIFLAFDAVDLDAGLLGDIGVQRFIRPLVAGRVQV